LYRDSAVKLELESKLLGGAGCAADDVTQQGNKSSCTRLLDMDELLICVPLQCMSQKNLSKPCHAEHTWPAKDW